MLGQQYGEQYTTAVPTAAGVGPVTCSVAIAQMDVTGPIGQIILDNGIVGGKIGVTAITRRKDTLIRIMKKLKQNSYSTRLTLMEVETLQ